MQNRKLRKCIKPHRKAKLARDELIVEMLTQGKKQREIAEAAGCTQPHVTHVNRKMLDKKFRTEKIYQNDSAKPEPPCPFLENDNWLEENPTHSVYGMLDVQRYATYQKRKLRK